MNKKYLILKSTIPKAQNGTDIPPIKDPWKVEPIKSFGMANAYLGIDDRGLKMPASPIATPGVDIDALKKSGLQQNTLDPQRTDYSGLIAQGTALANTGTNFLFENAKQKNSQTDGFGNQVIDKKQQNLMLGQEVASDALKGAGVGTKVGSMIGGPLGGLIGAGVGAGAGAITGLVMGKKKTAKAKEDYDIGLDSNTMAMGRKQDIQNSNALLGEKGSKLGKIEIPNKKKSKSLVLKNGGRIETPGEVNVVVKGKLHKENNNLGNKDKGIPVVDANGNKEYEVEAGEIIFRQEITHVIEDYSKRYLETGDESLCEELGKILVTEVLKNTQDNYGKFGIKLKN